MTYPNPQQGYPQPQQPAYPPPQSPQPGYLTQPPPGYPPQPQGYPPAQPQYAPPQQYGPPQGYAPPTPPPPMNASIDDFYNQPAASGKSIASWFQTPGQSITGVVARAISKADLRAQTDMQSKQPKYFSDGRPMLTMTIPLLVAPSRDFADGRAAWIINAADREDLDFAMQAAGCPPRSVPEAGAGITITFVGFKQIPGFGAPKKVKQIQYTRPAGAGDGLQQVAQAASGLPAPTPPAGYPVDGNGQYDPQAAPPVPPTVGPPFQQNYADPGGQAAADMVTGNQNAPGPGNGNVPNGQYQPYPGSPPIQQQMVPQEQVAHYGQPQAGYMPPVGQYVPQQDPYQQPNPAYPVEYALNGGMTPTQPPQQYAAPQQVAPPVPPTAPPAQPAPQQQWAAPADLTPDQQERLRQLTGQ
jgi:hypothetical protein